MKYIECINELIRKEAMAHDHVVAFGQNVNAGSYIGGFTRGIAVRPTGRIINATNAENSLCGLGFGLMIGGASAVFFMKQLDFLLLGIDQLVNSYNIIRNFSGKPSGSFTIMTIIMDNGYQGPQSSHNSFAEFCSIARIEGYTVTNKCDAEAIITSKMVSPGFRIIAISQRLFKEELIVPKTVVYRNDDATLFQYGKGNDATVVCFNFSFPQGWKLYNDMEARGLSVSLFNVNSPTPIQWDKIVHDVEKTRALVILDDSKSQNLACHALLAQVEGAVTLKKRAVITRKLGDDWLTPVSDQLEVAYEQLVDEFSEQGQKQPRVAISSSTIKP